MSQNINGLVGMRSPSKTARFLTEDDQRSLLIREGLSLVLELEDQAGELDEGSLGYRETMRLLDHARAELMSMGARFPRTDRRRAKNL